MGQLMPGKRCLKGKIRIKELEVMEVTESDRSVREGCSKKVTSE